MLQSDVLAAIRLFFLDILPPGVEVTKGQVNRVPEPRGDFVVMTPILLNRLATNTDTPSDTAFTASISGPTMTVSSATVGAIAIGNTVFGVGVAPGTKVIALVSPGVYTVAPSQTVASEQMSCGVTDIDQPTKMTIQLDVHGPASADNAQIISTAFRDAYAVEFLAPSGVAPFYADDPKQLPFINGEQGYEDRWVIDAVMQISTGITVPQQFADELEADVISVNAAYPA